MGKIQSNLFRINTISSESTTNSTDSELIPQICNVVYRMLTNKEAFEILERNDKFEWFRSEESANDWRRGLFYVEPNCVGTKINARNGDSWTDDKYNEWQKLQEQKKEEERNHQRKLEEIRRQQKLDEEAERERTRKANELFLASHQLIALTRSKLDFD